VAHPLSDATIDDLETFDWPDPLDEGRTQGLREEAAHKYKTTDYALVGDLSGVGVFETAWLMRGLSRFMEDLLIEKEFAVALLRKVTDLKKALYARFLEQVGDYLQVIMVSDDLGMENNLLISPEVYREMIKPFHNELWSSIKEKTDAFLFLHSCGSIYKLIPDLIELGVDSINPVQVAAKDMDTKMLKQEFGKSLSFWGGIDTQHVMPNGTPEEVEEEVKQRLHDLAPGGGYILCAVHNIQPGVPPENVMTMYEAAQTYGEYPITV
jgi:uroporphyrinogen decarboxylase